MEIKYNPDTGERLGLSGFPKTQIDTLGFQTLSDKVIRLLTGEMDFHSNSKELEFDEEEGQWSDPEPEMDPTNDFLDKTDIHDLHKEIIEKQRELAKKVNEVTQVEPGEGSIKEPLAKVEQSPDGATKKNSANAE